MGSNWFPYLKAFDGGKLIFALPPFGRKVPLIFSATTRRWGGRPETNNWPHNGWPSDGSVTGPASAMGEIGRGRSR